MRLLSAGFSWIVCTMIAAKSITAMRIEDGLGRLPRVALLHRRKTGNDHVLEL